MKLGKTGQATSNAPVLDALDFEKDTKHVTNTEYVIKLSSDDQNND